MKVGTPHCTVTFPILRSIKKAYNVFLGRGTDLFSDHWMGIQNTMDDQTPVQARAAPARVYLMRLIEVMEPFSRSASISS